MNVLKVQLSLGDGCTQGHVIRGNHSEKREQLSGALFDNKSVVQVAGFFVQSIPDWIGWLKYLSFIYYGYNTLLKVRLQMHSHHPITPNLLFRHAQPLSQCLLCFVCTCQYCTCLAYFQCLFPKAGHMDEC